MRLPRFVSWFGDTPSDPTVASAIVAEQLRYLRRQLLATACIQVVLASLIAVVTFGHVPFAVLGV